MYVKCEDGHAKNFACDSMLTDDCNFKLEKSQNDDFIWDSASKSSEQKEWDWEKLMNVKPENAQPTTFAWDPKYYHDCTNKFEKPQNDELFFLIQFQNHLYHENWTGRNRYALIPSQNNKNLLRLILDGPKIKPVYGMSQKMTN